MEITTVADLLKSLGADVPEPAAPPKPSVVSKAAQDPKTVKIKSKSASKWATMLANYPKYDPAVEGYGNADEWRGVFHARMGWEKAMKILGAKSPREILGVMAHATFDECRSAFKKLCKEWHPDRVVLEKKDPVEAAVKLEQIYAAFEVLEHEHEK